MKEMFIRFNKNDSVYELSTYEGFLKITRDDKIIHVQFANVNSQRLKDLGLKSMNDIAGNISEYIDLCEKMQMYKGITFESDEWERQTKIYVKIKYSSQDGELGYYKCQIDSVQGNMRGSHGDSLIDEKYWPFFSNPSEDNPEDHSPTKPMLTLEQLMEHLNTENKIPVYGM
ncbi:hypothetical protein bcgnr5378_07880 [Bacillus cereus]